MKLTLKDIARLVGGTLDGPDDLEICGVNDLAKAGASDLSFVQSKKHIDAAKASNAAAFLVPDSFGVVGRPCIRVTNPKYSFIRLLALAMPRPKGPTGIHGSAFIETGAQIGADCWVGPFAAIEEGASIGAGTRVEAGCFIGRGSKLGCGVVLHPNVTVYADSVVGDNVVVHAGSVIGADGFGYIQEGKKGEDDAKAAIARYAQLDEPHRKIPQLGRAWIGPDVEIGACVSIDRGTLGDTVIGRGCKIDNQVQIGHNTRLGEHVLIVAEVGIAGSVRIGNHVTIAGNCGIAEGADIGDYCILGAHTLVFPGKRFPPRSVVLGNPARIASKTLDQHKALSSLPRAIVKLAVLESRIAALEAGG